jgi:Nop14-like family
LAIITATRTSRETSRIILEVWLFVTSVLSVVSTSDFRHAVVGPASLFLCQCLSQCPVSSPSDVASGILSCFILLDFNRAVLVR